MQRLTYRNLNRNKAQFLSTTGLSLSCFDGFFPYFEERWIKYNVGFTNAGIPRIRPPRTYKNKVFEDNQSMLVFILYYLKNNCLQQSQAAMFGMTQPQANLWIHLLKTILLDALNACSCLPCRDFDSLQKLLYEGQDIFIDGSERTIPRPSDQDKQKEYYSGKKNSYC
jgi:hypothetical protein